MTPNYDLAIVGAGPAGSALAHAVARAGWRVALMEQRRLPTHKVCGEFLSPESQTSLANLDLVDVVAALRPQPMTSARLISPHGAALDAPLPGVAWGVSRYALDAALAGAAARAGADLRQEVTVTGVEAKMTHQRVHLRPADGPPTTLCARAVVLACGRHPSTSLRAVPPRGARGRIGLKQHVTGIDCAGRVELHFFRGGYVGLGPVEDDRVNLCLLVDRGAFARAGGRPEGVLAALRAWSPVLAERLASAEPVPETLKTVAAVDTRQPATPWWVHGPRVGDAAVMIPPLCGDGMAMALRGAALLAPQLDAHLRGHLPVAAFERVWQRTWHAEFDGPVSTGRVLERMLAMPGIVDVTLTMGRWLPFLTRRLVLATRGSAAPPGQQPCAPTPDGPA